MAGAASKKPAFVPFSGKPRRACADEEEQEEGASLLLGLGAPASKKRKTHAALQTLSDDDDDCVVLDDDLLLPPKKSAKPKGAATKKKPSKAAAAPAAKKRRRQGAASLYDTSSDEDDDEEWQPQQKKQRGRSSTTGGSKSTSKAGSRHSGVGGAAAGAAGPEVIVLSSDDDDESSDEEELGEEVALDEDGKPLLIVEHAKSDRSACKICKQQIVRKAVRIGELSDPYAGGPEESYYRFSHPECWKPTQVKPSAIPGWRKLSKEEQVALRNHIELRGPRADGGGSKAADWPLPARGIVVTAQLKAQVAELQAKYGKMTQKRLREVLIANACFHSGKKSEQVARCVEGEVLGAPPFPCPQCKVGRVGRATSAFAKTCFTCRGTWEKDDGAGGSLKPCSYGANADTLPFSPWVMPGDPGDRTAEVEGFSEAKRRRRDEELDAFASQVPAGWAGRVAAMDRKDAAQKVAEMCNRKGLDAVTRQEAGAALLATKTDDGELDPRAALLSLAKKYLPIGGAAAGGRA